MMAGLRTRAKDGDKSAENKLHEIEEILKEHPTVKSEAPVEEVADDESDLSKMMVKSSALQNFGSKPPAQAIECPPSAESRRFNECDVIGNLPRDDKGNVVAEPDAQGGHVDKDGRQTNARGYLVDPKTGDVINNLTQEKMFDAKELDERGELPAPFNVEKHNFNPHEVRGDFGYDRNGKAVIGKEGADFKDKRGSHVSSRGYRVDSAGNMLDHRGRRAFDKAQMTADGDLPKLFNYNGRRYDITDTIG
jgi:hypothetical protein